ncbi:MAG: HEAT repeat domain-containing protein, partial [Planctomycetota bacterium]
RAVETMEKAYGSADFSAKPKAEFLRRLFELYLLRHDLKGVERTLERLVKQKEVAPDEREIFEKRLEDIRKMGATAITVWEVEYFLRVVKNDGISSDVRRHALRALLEFIMNDDLVLTDKYLGELSAGMMKEAFKVLVDAPDELSMEMLRFFRNTIQDPRLIRIIVHFVYPNGKTPAVRAEAVRSLAVCSRQAALPALLYCLRDDAGMVAREVDKFLSELCERRSAVLPGIAPLTTDEIRQARRIWRAYTHSEEGAERLADAFATLSRIVENEPDHTRQLRSAPMVDHAVNLVLLDDDMPWPVWKAAYEFLVHYWGKHFRPVKRRGQPVEKFEREHVVREIEAYWQAEEQPAGPEVPEERGSEKDG